MSKPIRSDSILGCAAALREVENNTRVAMDRWGEANTTYKNLLTSPSGGAFPEQALVEETRVRAMNFYETLLDLYKLRFDLRAKLAALKSGRTDPVNASRLVDASERLDRRQPPKEAA